MSAGGFSVSVAGIVIDNENVLIIQRADNGAWEPPGGVLERGETYAQGVQREVFEETGLTVDVHGLSGVYLNMRQHIVALVFRCTVAAGQAKTTPETMALEWVPGDEAYQRMAPAFGIRVTDALQPPGEPAVRYHDGIDLLED